MPAPSPSHLVAPFTAVDAERVATLLRATHTLEAVSLERLATERDDTFRVRTADGLTVVAKLAHPLDDPRVLADQVAVLAGLEREHPTLPTPRVVPARDGALLVMVETDDGPRGLRVLSHLEGATLGSAARTLDDLHAVGVLHAQLARAIAAVGDAADSPLRGAPTPWNLLALEAYAASEAIADAAVRADADAVIAMARDAVLPLARTLPARLAHNDLHGDNVLVHPSAAGRPLRVTGVLDFGDMTRTPRVADLAVAASYARGRVGTSGPAWQAASAYVAGYESIEPLDEAEHALLPHLVLLRLAQRAVLNSRIAAANPAAADYASRNLSAIARDLRELGASIPTRIGGTP